jgi:hypothetical protein
MTATSHDIMNTFNFISTLKFEKLLTQGLTGTNWFIYVLSQPPRIHFRYHRLENKIYWAASDRPPDRISSFSYFSSWFEYRKLKMTHFFCCIWFDIWALIGSRREKFSAPWWSPSAGSLPGRPLQHVGVDRGLTRLTWSSSHRGLANFSSAPCPLNLNATASEG